MDFEEDRVRANVQNATTWDLLNRVTVFRAGMVPLAVDIIEEELFSRGLDRRDIQLHDQHLRAQVIILKEGFAATCSFCHEPAIHKAWNWHRLLGLIPLFPREYYYCREHHPNPEQITDAGSDGECQRAGTCS